ncbi:hypothetical protein [Helicobacter trogontum]|uniref:hypothetical protein n=1 Tax=Helicobacter trogontum TaxID=50960 RepID=UPI002A9163DB|nr:hypothetical protein [Helicobacter trogontum]MDY5186239.1 hypothetical protein [Helicobacter trogontum]
MIYKRVVYLLLALFLIAYSSENMQDDKNANLPNDIKNFIESREKFIESENVNSIQTMNEQERIKYSQMKNLKRKEIDKEFVALRSKYKENDLILDILSQYGCLLNDCSATSKGDDGFVFYKGVDITEAINNSLMDRNTFTSYPFFKEILETYPNILAKKENFSLDLSPSAKYRDYKKIDIVWSKDKTSIDFILYDEYFNQNICSHTASFTRFKQEKDGVKASYGYIQVPYTQNKEVNDFINKSCECIHIGGEEPYDEQRANELREMAQGCNDIPTMRSILQTKYKGDINLSKLLQREVQNYKEVFGE